MRTPEQIARDKIRHAWCRARRELHAEHLHPIYRKRYEHLCYILADSFWAPYSSYRSFEEQAKIYSSGRTSPGKIVTNARPGDSAHNWGCATDWAEFRPEYKAGDPWDRANWQYYAQCVEAAGLDWGGDWDRDGKTEKGENDFPHAQLPLRKPWRYIGDTYRLHGVENAQREIDLYVRPWEIR